MRNELLYHYLTHHPEIQGAAHKEVNFFQDSRHFQNGLSWYRAHFPLRRPAILSGEATPGYVSHPLAAKRVAEGLPDVKLIFLVRNPVDRAYSHYHHPGRAGREPTAFDEVIDRALAPADHRHHPSEEPRPRSYLTRGVYVDQLQRWHGFFPSERLLVVRSEDLFERPAETVGRVLDFLGPRGWQQQRYRRFNTHPHSPIPDGMRMRLREYFRPHNARLSAHLGWNLDWDA